MASTTRLVEHHHLALRFPVLFAQSQVASYCSKHNRDLKRTALLIILLNYELQHSPLTHALLGLAAKLASPAAEEMPANNTA